MKPAPPIDPRNAETIAQQVQARLAETLPQFVSNGRPLPLSGFHQALVNIFARFSELMIQRLNQVPDKNFLAFLDMLGASRLPPQPARVPLTFFLAPGSAVDAVVPAGTQVAAPPAEGQQEPIVFETERSLMVTAAQLEQVFVRDPEQDLYSNYQSLTLLSEVGEPSEFGRSALRGDRAIDHVLYLGHPHLLRMDKAAQFQVFIGLDRPPENAQALVQHLEWQFWNGTTWETKTPINATLSSGFLPEVQVPGIALGFDFGSVDPIPLSRVHGLENRWIRCRFITPLNQAEQPRLGMVLSNELPNFRKIMLFVSLRRNDNLLLPDLAFANTTAAEVEKPFLPFGEKPQPNAALYLASKEAFSKDGLFSTTSEGAVVSFNITVTNSWLLPSPTSVRPDYNLQLAWECWNGRTWQEVGRSDPPPWLHQLELEPLPSIVLQRRNSIRVRGTAKIGTTLTFTLRDAGPSETVMKTIAIVEDSRFSEELGLNDRLSIITCTATESSQFTRAWLVFFQDGADATSRAQLTVTPPGAPIVDGFVSLQVSISGQPNNTNLIQAIRVTNGRFPNNANAEVGVINPVLQARTNPATSIQIPLEFGRNDLLIEGMDARGGTTFTATTLMLVREAPAQSISALNFEDGTHGFRQSGRVMLRLPRTLERISVNGQENYWLRVRLARGSYGQEAAYELKDRLDPSEGFNLLPATFRPPIVQGFQLRYAQTLRASPEPALIENHLNVEDVTAEATVGSDFRPFQAAPESYPTLYFGFALPSDRLQFPNNTLSLFLQTANVSYGETLLPLSPVQSRAARSAPNSTDPVIHRFLLTNPTDLPQTFRVTLRGSQWKPDPLLISVTQTDTGTRRRRLTLPVDLTLLPEELQLLEVQVTIPAEALTGDRDQGFLQLTQLIPAQAPAPIVTATFETVADAEVPRGDRPSLVWQYWNGRDWETLIVRDSTQHLLCSGVVEVLPPADFRPKQEFGLLRYWLRLVWDRGIFPLPPRLSRILLNTTTALQTITISNEELGSSNGNENQQFRATRIPLLQKQQLVVREPEIPPIAEQLQIRQEEGEDAITLVKNSLTNRDVWVRWHEVPDFFASNPRDRHYQINHLTGEIQFGNGRNGLIPPVGVGNIQLRRYQTGGGVIGNRPANTIVQLNTTIPLIDRVLNVEAATGGAEAESLDSLRDRLPKTVRHGSRAVTFEDFEDLAKLATPEVARAKCIPLRNLQLDPLDATVRPGDVSLILVPNSATLKPLPYLELIERVHAYLQAHMSPMLNLAIVGPLYMKVSLTVEIAITAPDQASTIQQTVDQQITRFLHPLTGDFDGQGWEFGREPFASDFYRLIESIPGVDHVRYLEVNIQEDFPGIQQTGRFLVYSGKHTLHLRSQ